MQMPFIVQSRPCATPESPNSALTEARTAGLAGVPVFLTQEFEASQRATAKMLGVSHTTIDRDLKNGTNVPSEDSEAAENSEKTNDNGTNVPPAWFQDDVDPALSELKSSRGFCPARAHL